MLVDVIRRYGGVETPAFAVYADIFRLGENVIQQVNEPGGSFKTNPLGYMKKSMSAKGVYRIMFEDTFEDTLKELQESEFAIINGLTYFGRKNNQENASKMYAMIIDLDGVDDKGLANFFHAAMSTSYNFYPMPNYVILSGHGVHLYYLFEEPIPLYPNIKMQLKELKYALTKRIWNRNVTKLHEQVQYQGINQGFRVIGGKTKIPGVVVTAYKLNSHPYTIDQMNEYIPDEQRLNQENLWKESNMTLAVAKRKYPQWYEKIVLNREPKGTWTCKEDLYYWWLRQIKNGAHYGHRYFCIMCLSIYAIKSGISKEQLERDSLELIPFMNELNENEPFTETDVFSAMECYDVKYKTFPIDDISRLSAIVIQKNKRNGLRQKDHLEIARAIQNIKDRQQGKNWRDGNGRKSKQDIVIEWQHNNNNGRKADCIRDTGLSKPTVYKWWREDIEHENDKTDCK